MSETEKVPPIDIEEALSLVEDEKSELDKVLELLLDQNNIQHNTELNKREITAFSVLATIAKKYDLSVLNGFLKENLVLRVSKGRAGRKEWVKIVARHLDHQMEEEEKKGSSRWFRR